MCFGSYTTLLMHIVLPHPPDLKSAVDRHSADGAPDRYDGRFYVHEQLQLFIDACSNCWLFES